MTPLHRLVVWFCCVMWARCLVGQPVSWPSDLSEEKGLHRMLLVNDGHQLIISGLKGVYNLNTSDFYILNSDVTGSSDVSINDVIKIMIYNGTEVGHGTFVTTCNSTRDRCDVREIGDISRSVYHLKPPIKIDGVTAVMAEYGGVDFLFVGCPHVGGQEQLNGRCAKPGIAWYLNSGDSKSNQLYGFKSYERTPVLTTKYVDAFIVENFRLFFSLQRVKASNERRSRIAQVCQYFNEHDRTYTTPYTYADMSLECGEFKVIRAVKKVTIEKKLVFLALFSKDSKSAVCLYEMDDIKKRFVENIKKCYRGILPREFDYIKIPPKTVLCNKPTPVNETFDNPDDFFLCNKDNLQSYHQVIGSQALNAQPSVQYNSSLTSITVTVKDSNIIAFLGTENGYILKALVRPSSPASSVKLGRIHNAGYGIQKDMYTSKDGKHIFFLTERQVFKEPVEACSGFLSCDTCLGSKDPYCGWCFLENRCGINDTCASSRWIPASGEGQCPHVVSISPEVMSDKEILALKMRVSHALPLVAVQCDFHSHEIVEFRHSEPARVFGDGRNVTCKPRNISAIENKMKGFLAITVSIVTNVSDTSAMDGQFIMYRCETFDRCRDCTAGNWTCKWCTYTNQCIERDSDCEPNDVEVRSGNECPQVTGYTVVNDDDSVKDPNGTVYLSRDGNYTINVTGSNLPHPQTGPMMYQCKIDVSGTDTLLFGMSMFDAAGGGSFVCMIKKEKMLTIPETLSRLEANVQVMWGQSPVDGDTMPVIIYRCENLVKPSSNCGRCKSFARFQPHLHCRWCVNSCIDSENVCNSTSSECGDPEITNVYPLSAHMNATTQIEIEGSNLGSVFNDTIDAVTIAGIQCTSNESLYHPGNKIVCELAPSDSVKEGSIVINLGNNATGNYSKLFKFQNPTVTSIEPKYGPQSGGTYVTIRGTYLDTGRRKKVTIGGKSCILLRQSEPKSSYEMNNNGSHVIVKKASAKLVCKTKSRDPKKLDAPLEISVHFDDADVIVKENVSYKYVVDPNITAINPKQSFKCGGRKLTIEGKNLDAIQKPMIYALVGDEGDERLKSEACERDDALKRIYCPSPRYNQSKEKRSTDAVLARIGFDMDDVVSAVNLSSNLAVLMYFPDPILQNFSEVKIYKDLQGLLVIKGQRLRVAADLEDTLITIGCGTCNVTSMTNEAIICEPPIEEPRCGKASDHRQSVQVNIGFLQRDVGVLEYKASNSPGDDGVTKSEYIVAATVVGVLVLCLLITLPVVCVMLKKRKYMKKEKKGLKYKMDKLEAKFRIQCREEFAALQTAVSDLTSDLEGGNVLFRDYDVYACKTLFTSHKSDSLMSPPAPVTEQSQQAMETYKGLLRNRQFLMMLIKTLEKQNSFTIYDKSNVATVLMVLNHDNVEYITGILTSLLNELIDKTIASGTPKLLLRRSECVAEKLLTHWLSICLYHYLKDCSGSALYILYKAIKIQTEKGPIDYISNCGKYTLSEDKLFTSADTEINPVTLNLEVKHFDYTDNKEKQIRVQVLDCDTITQAKNKMLEILYKNVPYSQRPAVHSTSLEMEEGGEGMKRLLNDEDASSVKEGLWKRINTLKHYNVHDESKVNLYLDREMEASCSSLAGVSPDAFIVGSFRRSKPIVRTISGSNFWHMTKKHQTEDEVQLASDLFLPRLLNTKGTLQTYIDDLFDAILCVGDEPPLIVKYLFDLLDSAASRCNMKDPDVLHTWKCNSLLLRFWVNIIKNPEFVFDIHKPHIVDSCLSVVAQTLMDSCSTADLVLGPSSPSNKLLFAKDIPRYKTKVRQYFQEMKQKPAVSDQDLNSYLTQNVSQKFSGKFYHSAALLEMYKYTERYRNKICDEMDNLEASSPGTFSHLTSKLQYIFMCMDTIRNDDRTASDFD